MPRSAFLRAVGQLCTAHCRPVSSRPAIMPPWNLTVPPQPRGASDLTAPKRPPGPPALTKPTQHSQSGPVSTLLPSCSAAISQQPIITALNTQRSDFAFIKPNSQPGLQCAPPEANAWSLLVHYIIHVHHKTPHQPKRGTHQPTNQRRATAPKCWPLKESPPPRALTLLAAISESKAAAFRFWRATSGLELPPAVLFPSSNVSSRP